MKDRFQQYFRPTQDELDALLKSAVISYDANVLLNVYRYSGATQKALEEIFKAFANRTHLSHQAALEYARNREKIILDQVKLCQKTEDAIKNIVKDFTEPKDKQPFLSEESCQALNAVMKELTEKKSYLETMVSNDRYADLLHELFEKKIGTAPDEAALKKLHEQAADRYDKKIPPGYSDLKEKTVPRAYGDYILWRELIEIAKAEQNDLILVTNESKEDWILEINGRKLGPRPELREEFRKETSKRVWLYSTESFLIATQRAGSTTVSDKVIEEVSARAQASVIVSDKKLTAAESEIFENFVQQIKRSERQDSETDSEGELKKPLVRDDGADES
jgi:hypothetical protein